MNNNRKQLFNILLTFLLLSSIIFIFSPLKPTTVSATYGDWLYVKKITITASNDDQHYRLNISKSSGGDVDCEGHCNNNFSDLRLLRTGNSTRIPIFYDYVNTGNYAVIWFCNKDNDTTLWLYYGNSSAAPLNEPTKVWEFWEDWRTTNYLGSYTWINTTSYKTAFKDISNTFNTGKMFLYNFSYLNTFASTTGWHMHGFCDNVEYSTPNEMMAWCPYNDQDDIAGEDNADLISFFRTRHSDTQTQTSMALINNMEGFYLRVLMSVNASKASYGSYTTGYSSLTTHSSTTNLPTDLDYETWQVSNSVVDANHGIKFDTNRLMIWSNRGSSANCTLYYYTVAVGNFTDDKTTFSFGAESSTATPLPSGPVYFEAQTQNSSWIMLNWTKGSSGVDKTVIIANDTVYPTLGVDTVIYNGTGSWYNHTGLTNNTHWFYLCYSYNSTSKFNDTFLHDHDTTMGIPISEINMDLNNCSGSYTNTYLARVLYNETATVTDMPDSATDGDWGTLSHCGDGTFHANYTIPSGYQLAKWEVKSANAGRVNFTLPPAVMAEAMVCCEYVGDMVLSEDRFYVYYAGSYHLLGTYPGASFGDLYEEAMWFYREGYYVNFTAESQLNLINNSAHVHGPLLGVWNGTSFAWDIFVNLTGNTSGLVVSNNSVNCSGTIEYEFRPLTGVDGEWWVWVNLTGNGTGGGVNVTHVLISQTRSLVPLVVIGGFFSIIMVPRMFKRKRRQE